jgi:hypothetical protein
LVDLVEYIMMHGLTKPEFSKGGLPKQLSSKREYVKMGPVYFTVGKTIPLQAWTDPEGSRSLRLPDFKTIGT